jgi:ATP-dependent RNA helicase SUPV3L1/SUV3
MWGEHAVGKLALGDDPLKPQITAFVDDTAGPDVTQKVQRRLQHFIDRKIDSLFEPLMLLKRDEGLNGLARGFAFRMVEGFGILPRTDVADDVKALDQDARGMLRKHGVRFGQFTIFMPLLLKPAATRLRIILWSLAQRLDEFPISPPPGLVTIPVDTSAPAGYDIMAGYRNSNTRAIRIDMLERLADMIRTENTRVGFEAKPDMLSITGMTLEQFADLLQGLGYNSEKLERDKVKAAPAGVSVAEESQSPTNADAANTEPDPNGESPTPEVLLSSAPVVDFAKADKSTDASPTDPEVANVVATTDSDETTEPQSDELADVVASSVAKSSEPVEKETYFVFTWSTRRKPTNTHPKRDFRKPDDQGKSNNRPKGKRNQQKDGQKLRTHQLKPEKIQKIDPDNPFAAALMGLKTRN